HAGRLSAPAGQAGREGTAGRTKGREGMSTVPMPTEGDVDDAGGYAVGLRTAAGYIEQMQRIEGWLSTSDAAWFVQVDEMQKAFGIDGDMVEIGVWHGRGAILFHHLLRESERVFAVDIFDLRDSEHRFFNDPARLRENAGAFGCDDRLVPV